MARSTLIGVRHVSAGGRQIPVVLTRNERGSVAGQCLLGEQERPIFDAPGVPEVLALIQDTLEALMLSRGEHVPGGRGHVEQAHAGLLR